MSTTRYSAIERGEREPSKLEAGLIDKFLPQLPAAALPQLDGTAVEACDVEARPFQTARDGVTPEVVPEGE